MSFLTGDQIGSFAELLAMTDLSRPVVGRYRRPLFRVTALGAKYPAVDFLIDVLDANDDSLGFFFAQVKGTSKKISGTSARLAVNVELESFNRLVRVPAPAYLIGVDVNAEASYLVAAYRTRANDVSSITRAFPLADPIVKMNLYQEVLAFWRANRPLLQRTQFKDV
jgi:hypothetical protein